MEGVQRPILERRTLGHLVSQALDDIVLVGESVLEKHVEEVGVRKLLLWIAEPVQEGCGHLSWS